MTGTKKNSGRLYRNILSGERKSDDLECRCFNCNYIYEFEVGRLSIPVEVEV